MWETHINITALFFVPYRPAFSSRVTDSAPNSLALILSGGVSVAQLDLYLGVPVGIRCVDEFRKALLPPEGLVVATEPQSDRGYDGGFALKW